MEPGVGPFPDLKVKMQTGDSRRDEASGTGSHVPVLLPGLHVSSLGGHTLSPEQIRHQVTVRYRDNQLGPKMGFEDFAIHLAVLHLEGSSGTNTLAAKLISYLTVGENQRKIWEQWLDV